MLDNREMIIVEDNNNDAELILDALRESDLNVNAQLFRDGAEAAKYFFDSTSKFIVEKIEPPLLVLMDLKLPKLNGLEVLKFLKSNEKTKYVPVVIFTSSNEERDRMASYALGANSYLIKPLDADEYAKYVMQLVYYWVKMNSPSC